MIDIVLTDVVKFASKNVKMLSEINLVKQKKNLLKF